jgi:hypothetical protein
MAARQGSLTNENPLFLPVRRAMVMWSFTNHLAQGTPPMAKKAPAPKKVVADSSKQLIEAIATVKQLQDFVKEHGSAEKALAAVLRVQGLIEMTGGCEQLKQALEIVGQEAAVPQS